MDEFESADVQSVTSNDENASRGPIKASLLILRNRVIAGFFVALPIIVTFIIIRWLYNFIVKDIIATIAKWLLRIWGSRLAVAKGENGEFELPFYIEYIFAPVAAIALILAVLFLLGMFFRSRTHRLVDWILKNVPGIGVIYSAVSNAIESIRKTRSESGKFQRVVLVQFPHAGMKVPAFVTSTCIDRSTGKKILCIYVPTTPIPTSGYMLLVPEEDVTEISWDLSETLQAIVSGGITVPDYVEYHGSPLLENPSPAVENDSD